MLNRWVKVGEGFSSFNVHKWVVKTKRQKMNSAHEGISQSCEIS